MSRRIAATAMDQAHIRNFSIIAHIDHGKSTLADRILEITGTVDPRDDARPGARLDGPRARARDHDQGPGRARRSTRRDDGETYQLHLIDTPGHVDFTYEVSRSLAACEGALLVVDAAQGVEAQTRRQHLPGDRRGPRADPVPEQGRPARAPSPSASAGEIADLLGEPADDDPARSPAKTGEGVAEVLEAIVAARPAARRATPTRRRAR